MDKFCLLECREIENLLDKPVLIKIIENDPRFSNFTIDFDFEYEDYKTVKLNEFIKDKCKDFEENFIGSKKPFYYKAKKHIKNWSDLSLEAQNITVRLYDFIKDNNS